MARSTQRRLWTRPEQMRALELYLKTPFGRIHNTNPAIVNLAEQLDRTAGALALKMSNFAALDPTIPQRGMGNYSKTDALIWEEFFASPAEFLDKVPLIEPIYETQVDIASSHSNFRNSEFKEGEDIVREVKTRKHQSFFREMLIASYRGKCAVTDISQPELLVASHIKPWAKGKEARLNPRNGILLNALHDRAFDRGLISFDNDYNLIKSSKLHESDMAKSFFSNKRLTLPEKFAPDPDFLAYHREHCFLR